MDSFNTYIFMSPNLSWIVWMSPQTITTTYCFQLNAIALHVSYSATWDISIWLEYVKIWLLCLFVELNTEKSLPLIKCKWQKSKTKKTYIFNKKEKERKDNYTSFGRYTIVYEHLHSSSKTTSGCRTGILFHSFYSE